MKLAALDLGSNSFHLLVANVDSRRELRRLGSDKDVLRLGRIVQEHGVLTGEAFDAALKSVRRLSDRASELGAEHLCAVGTSALRDARNGSTFLTACQERLGVEVELLSGESEGALVFAGARSAFATDASRTLVADLGGGSLELACGERSSCEVARSLPLGFLRLAGAFPVGAPGGAARLARYVEAECQKVRFQIGRFDTLVLAGGTARAVGKLFVGHDVIPPDVWLTLCTTLSMMTPEELKAIGVARDRVDTLAAGAAVLAGLLAAFGNRDVRLSPHGLREGVLLREIDRRAPVTYDADLATA